MTANSTEMTEFFFIHLYIIKGIRKSFDVNLSLISTVYQTSNLTKFLYFIFAEKTFLHWHCQVKSQECIHLHRIEFLRNQYARVQINPVPWPSDAEGLVAKKEHKKSEAKKEAEPRSVLTERTKSTCSTRNSTRSIRSEEPNTDVIIPAVVKARKKRDPEKQCSRLCSSLCPLVPSTCPLPRKSKRVSTRRIRRLHLHLGPRLR